ncbi:MAG: methyltransferase domain-containing protein [Pirellulales bacterium]|nr:methyltransferase domain-containing protein [Pirellulales bacterium]
MDERAGPRTNLSELLLACTCPACAHHVAVPFYHGGHQPLTTLAWPRSSAAAAAMRRLPLDFVRCVDCGHVFNRAFDYTAVPYSDKPNLMFNRGRTWGTHLHRVATLMLAPLPAAPTIVEVGCGDAHLLRSLAELRPQGRYVGFDPHAVPDTRHHDAGIEVHAALFDPAVHMAEFRPDLIVSRHVLEHLTNPLGFLQSLAFAASWEGVETRLFIEVPCIDRALALGRTVDFFYEHNSHFTSQSFGRLLARCASQVELVERGYNDEVVYGLARFAPLLRQTQTAHEALAFARQAATASARVRDELTQLARSGQRIAIWGGTGKAAAFINQYALDAARFPLVVDSDADKAGTYVPGTGQEIRHRDYLLNHPVDVVLVATQWRVHDIALEMQRHGIQPRQILIEHQGRLIDFANGHHPYRPETPSPTPTRGQQAGPAPHLPTWSVESGNALA